MPRARDNVRRLLVLCAALALPAAAQPVDELQAGDALVQTIGWRLARANAAFCTRTAPGIGLLLQDARTFNDPAAARATYGLTGDISVGAVAAGSPAARAGLAANATLSAVAGQAVSAIPPAQGRGWSRVLALQERMEETAASKGHVELTLADGRVVTISGEPACAVRFLLDDGKGNAGASRKEARIGRRMVDDVGAEPDMVAAVLAHELAHAALDHQTLLERTHRAVAVVRTTEREADRLSVWLLANAGYDPQAAVRMMARIGPKHQFILAPATHGGWKSRVAEMSAEIAALRAAPDGNWRTHFRRET